MKVYSGLPPSATATRMVNYCRNRLLGTLTYLAMAVAGVSTAHGQFVTPASMPIDGTFTGWGQAGTFSVADEVGTPAPDVIRVWSGIGTTKGGGDALVTGVNEIEYIYYRFDYGAYTSGKFNIQLNLGLAAPGKVDHLLEIAKDGAEVLIFLRKYSAPYPDVGAFTTGLFDEPTVGDNSIDTRAFGVVGTDRLELRIPFDWYTAQGSVKADGTGTASIYGAVFSSTGSPNGSVGTTKDILHDRFGETVILATNVITGRTTFESGLASKLAITAEPADAVSGETLDPITVAIQDSTGTTVASASHEITVRILSGPTGAVLSGTLTVSAVNGVATFDDLSLNLAGTYTLCVEGPNVVSGTSEPFTITVAGSSAPTITGPGAATGTTSAISVAENLTAVYDFSADETVTWSLNGGADAAKFAIDTTTGALTFQSAPDFEIAGDADANNEYIVVVRASDGTSSTDQTLTVKVTDVDEVPPTFNAPGSSPADDAGEVALTSNLVLDFSEPVVAGTGTIELRSTADDVLIESFDVTADAGAGSGQVSFSADGVTLNPTDTLRAGTAYHVIVAPTAVEDAAGNAFAGIADATTYNFTSAAASAPPASPPTVTGPGSATGTTSSISVAETLTAVYDFSADRAVTWSLNGGADAAKFTIDSTTGALSFQSAPDFEIAGDADANNEYIVVVRASDGSSSTDQTLTVKVTDVDEVPPTFDAPGSSPADDAGEVALTSNLVLDFSEPVVAGTGTIELRSTADDVLIESFDVTADAGAGSGQVSFSADGVTLNPTDTLRAGTAYHVIVAATAVEDAAGNAFAGIADTTTYNFTSAAASAPPASPPTVTGPGSATGTTSSISVAENLTAVYDFSADRAVTWSLNGGADAAKFAIDTTTGALSFQSAPDFEVAGDADANNEYIVVVRASDGSSSTDQTLTVKVTDVDEVPPNFNAPGSSPADDAGEVALTSNLVLDFSEPVVAGTGTIELRSTADDVLIESFDVTADAGAGSGQVSFSADGVTLNPTDTPRAGTAYHVIVAATAVEDAAGNAFAGIADATTYNFTTIVSKAVIYSTRPAVLSEANLDGAEITVDLSGGTYNVDLAPQHFSLATAPPGISIAAVTHTSLTRAVLTLSYDGTNFDSASTLSVNVLADALATGSPATTGTKPIEAIAEPNPNAPANTKLTGPNSVMVGGVAGPFEITVVDEAGNPTTVSDSTLFALSARPVSDPQSNAFSFVRAPSFTILGGPNAGPGGALVNDFGSMSSAGGQVFGEFFSDAAGELGITQIYIESGRSSTIFYFQPTVPGQLNIVATRIDGEDVGSAALTRELDVITDVELAGPMSVDAGQVAGPFTLTTMDVDGVATAVNEATSFELVSSSPGDIAFFSDPAGANEITGVMFPVGDSIVTFYYRDTQAALQTITASWLSGGADLGQAAAQIAVRPVPPPSPKTTTITATPSSISADGESTSMILIQLKDIFGNDMDTGGVPVTLEASEGSLTSLVDNGDGTYSATLTSTESVVASTISGTLAGERIVDTDTVTFTAVPPSIRPAASVSIAGPTHVTAGVVSGPVSISIRDSKGDATTVAVASQFELTSTSSGTSTFYSDPAGESPITSVTIGVGQSKAEFYYADVRAGQPTISAVGKAGNTLGSAAHELTVVSAGASAAKSTIDAEPGYLPADGASKSRITVHLRDRFGNEIPSDDEMVELRSSGGTLGEATYQSEGLYSATLTAGMDAGTAVVRGTLDGIEIADSATVIFGGMKMVIGELPDSVYVDSVTSATVRVMDSRGELAILYSGDITLALADTASGAKLTGTITMEVEHGVADFSDLRIDRAGKGYLLTATVAGDHLAPAFSEPFDVVLEPVDLELSIVPSNDRPAPGDTLTYTVTVLNRGPGRAVGVEVMTPLPPRMEFVDSDASSGEYEPEAGTWTISSIDDGATETLRIRVVARPEDSNGGAGE